MDRPIDTANQLKLPFGFYSHWLQPWRAYLDTVPASALRDAVGINFNVGAAEYAPTARLLAASGVRRARVEYGWGTMDGDRPDRMQPYEEAKLRGSVEAMKANGIRPLVLLNSNEGQPAPLKRLELQLTEPGAIGSTTVRLSPSSAATVVPNHTGFDGRDRYMAAQVLITSVAPDGTATLAKPLPWALGPEAYAASTLRFLPFARPFAGSAPNPDYLETLQGWLSYVQAVGDVVRSVLGNDEFDFEIWNELSFGSDFLFRDRYFSTTTGTGAIDHQLPRDTLAFIRDPAHGFPNAGVTNGFEAQRPWASGATSPSGLTAISKHPYHGVDRFPAATRVNGNRPVDALGQVDATQVGPDSWQPKFVPRYDSLFPEYFLSAIQTESLVRDISPLTTSVFGTPHGRLTAAVGSTPPKIWATEINLDPSGADLSTPQHTVLPSGFSAADGRHTESKSVLRYLSSFVNKGVGAVYFYAAKEHGPLSLVDPSFYAAVAAGRDPGPQAGGETMDSLRRFMAEFRGPDRLDIPRQLTLERIGDFNETKQFEGDGTAAHPPLYNRDVLAFLPFQVTDKRFVIPTYVMTRNMLTVWQPELGAAAPARLDLKPETYRLRIGNLGTCALNASATDPLTRDVVSVDIVSCENGTAEIDMAVTDSPRLLTLDIA